MKLRLAVLVLLAACGTSVSEELTATSTEELASDGLYDCQAPAQRFTCAPPADPHERFICHATGSATNPYEKLSVGLPSKHRPGVPHGNHVPDQAPGASANDLGGPVGLDCDCEYRVCQGTCTGGEQGAACDDANLCTGDGTCNGDVCEPGAPSCVDGTAVDACTAETGACEPSTGVCETAPLPPGTSCGDALVCNGASACVDVAHVAINEVESSGGVPGDWIELVNAGTTTADVSGWRVLDNDNTHTPYTLPIGTVIPVGGYLVVEEAQLGFGLGAADSARLFDATSSLVDSYTWTAHAVTTYGRCPNATGAFRTVTTSTKGAANDCSISLRINEIESSGGVPGDWVELVNAGPFALDLSGWIFRDNDDTHAYVLPAGTTLAAGARLVLDEAQFGFGLGAADSARIFDSGGTLIDGYTWTAHAATTYARCPDGSGAFATSASSTKGAANSCGSTAPPAQAWPGPNAVTTADGVNTFGGNGSGLFHDGSSLWVARNAPGQLFRLEQSGAIWAPVQTWTLRYPDGTGNPDAEDLTKAELTSTAIYVATERNNDASSTSRMSILRYDTAGTGTELVATHEWNLTSDLPVAGANLGLEAITWIPDTFLVANAWFDPSKGHAYNPADYPNHGTGIFFVGVEQTGDIHAYALDHVGGGFSRLATFASGDVTSKALSFDRGTGYLWSFCGASCGQQSAVWTITLGVLQRRRQFAGPSSMPNLANEGIAIAPETQCSGGMKPFFWIDDGETGGHALRSDAIPCGPFVP
jgi:hypothetical protein